VTTRRGRRIARVAESLGLGYLEAASSTDFDTGDAPSWAEGLWENVMIGTHEGTESRGLRLGRMGMGRGGCV
jgi:hypothetical protein